MRFLRRVVHPVLISLVLLATGLMATTGCTNPSSSTTQSAPSSISLSLGQFPSDKPSYHIYVDFWNGSTFLSESDLGLSRAEGLVYDHLALPSGTTGFGIFLVNPQSLNSDPLYFDYYSLSPSDLSLASYYWLDYGLYFNATPQKIRYGISEQAATELTSLTDLNLDFRRAPYFLYRYANAGANQIRASYQSIGDPVQATFESSMSDVVRDHKYASSWDFSSSGTLTTSSTPVYLAVEPSEYSQSTNATVSFTEVTRVAITDTITCLVPTDKPNLVYAVTTNSHSLYGIDPVAKSVSLIGQLPLPNIRELVYSAADHKLYGYTTNSGTVLVYDIDHNTSQTSVYAPSVTGSAIAISPTERRIYLCAKTSSYNIKLYILNQDTLEVITSGSLANSAGDLSYSLSEKAILYSSGYSITKYSVANDVIAQSIEKYASTDYYGDNGFIVNHTGSQLVYANIGTGYFVRTIDTNTMQVNSTWNIGAYPQRSLYSADDRSIFASIGDGKVYQALTSDFSQTTSYLFPPTYFVVNSDSSRLVGFVDTEKSFYFADVSAGIPSRQLSAGTLAALGASSRSMGLAPEFLRRPGH